VPWGRGEGGGDGDGSAMVRCAASGICGTSRSQKFCEHEREVPVHTKCSQNL
jgi:hypothetical protein